MGRNLIGCLSIGLVACAAVPKPEVLAADLYSPHVVGLDATSVYVIAHERPSQMGYRIFRLPKSGGELEPIPHVGVSLNIGARAFDVSSKRLAWADGSTIGWIDKDDAVGAAHSWQGPDVMGSPILPLLLLDGDDFFWSVTRPRAPLVHGRIRDDGTSLAPEVAASEVASNQAAPLDMMVDRSNLCWTILGEKGDGAVLQAPSVGGTPIVLARGQRAPRSLAADADSIYWIVEESEAASRNALMRVRKAGGAATALAHNVGGGPIAAFGGFVYFTDTENRVRKVPERGGAPITVAESGNTPRGGVWVDASGVYFAEYHSGSKPDGLVLRAAP